MRVVASLVASLVIGVLASLPAPSRSAAQEGPPVPPDALLLAQADLAIGRSEAASTGFLDVLTSGPIEFREQAWTGLIRARASAGRNGEAVNLATALLRHDPIERERVDYLLGRAAFDAADFDRAATAFRSVALGSGPLASLARLRTAQALAATRRPRLPSTSRHATRRRSPSCGSWHGARALRP